MGLDTRHYVRRPPWQSGSSGFLGDFTPVCKAILIANIVVFIAQIFVTRPSTLDDFPKELTQYIDEEIQFEEELWQDDTLLEPGSTKPHDSTESSGTPAPTSNSADSVDEETRKDLEAEKNKRIRELRKTRERQKRQMMRAMPRSSVVEDWFSLDPDKVKQGQIWRLVTSAFLHDRMGVFHLLFNMLFLYWFGRRLEAMYGSKEFCLFYFASAICASVLFLMLQWYLGDSTPAIGASGAIWGVLMLYAIHYPYETINIYFFFPVQIRWLVVVYLIFDLHPVLLSLSMPDASFSDGTAHAAHLGGALFGFLFYKQKWRLTPVWDSLPLVGSQGPYRPRPVRSPSRGNLKIYKGDHEPVRRSPLDDEVDRVLDKINQQGRESLTDEEVKTLEQASRRYRND